MCTTILSKRHVKFYCHNSFAPSQSITRFCVMACSVCTELLLVDTDFFRPSRVSIFIKLIIFPPFQYTHHHSYYCLTFHTRVCHVFLAVVFPCLRVLMHGCCYPIRLITRSTLCLIHPTYMTTTWLLPVGTRRRILVVFT